MNTLGCVRTLSEPRSVLRLLHHLCRSLPGNLARFWKRGMAFWCCAFFTSTRHIRDGCHWKTDTDNNRRAAISLLLFTWPINVVEFCL